MMPKRKLQGIYTEHGFRIRTPPNPELAAAYEQGLNAVKTYLRAKAENRIVLNEAKVLQQLRHPVDLLPFTSFCKGRPQALGCNAVGVIVKPMYFVLNS